MLVIVATALIAIILLYINLTSEVDHPNPHGRMVGESRGSVFRVGDKVRTNTHLIPNGSRDWWLAHETDATGREIEFRAEPGKTGSIVAGSGSGAHAVVEWDEQSWRKYKKNETLIVPMHRKSIALDWIELI